MMILSFRKYPHLNDDSPVTMNNNQNTDKTENQVVESTPPKKEHNEAPKEIGGRKDGLDPTRYGDWEKNGRCIDF